MVCHPAAEQAGLLYKALTGSNSSRRERKSSFVQYIPDIVPMAKVSHMAKPNLTMGECIQGHG